MTSPLPRIALAAVTGAGLGLLPAAVAWADPSPSPSSTTLSKAGTSFLTVPTVGIDQQVRLGASTGDYLYWSFSATAGQTSQVAITVTLPPAGSRHHASTWAVDVFDGLRRRQACTAGAQAPVADEAHTSVALGCTLREVRSWAEPWSGDPLPGTYYIRLSVVDLSEEDLGLPIQVEMRIAATDDGDPEPEGGELAAPLVPISRSGVTLTSVDGPGVSPSPSSSAEAIVAQGESWYAASAARWIWTSAGGALAAVAGVLGFRIVMRRRRSVAAPGQ